MLKKLIRFFSGNSDDNAYPDEPHIVPARDHDVRPDDISAGAAKVVGVLLDNGFQAYVVGGSVRDLLLGLKPKDFDVATDATPEQARQLFRRARLIGRRFRIVHVYMGREVVEVTTFRASHTGGARSDEGRLLRDNVFGDIDEDARRRDLTINALYYNPRNNTLYDYANGLRDIRKRQVQVIGDPETRFREDPVRMLRAVRFAAKLGFDIHPATARAIHDFSHLLADIPPARLFDEFLKLFLSGQALATFHLLREYGLFRELFPDTDPFLGDANPGNGDDYNLRFLEQAMINTDQRIRTGKRVTPAFLLAALMWPVLVMRREEIQAGGESPAIAIQRAGGDVIARQVKRVAIPRRFSQPMREIWELQHRLPNRHGNRAEHLISTPRFRAGYDFVLLREQAGEDLDNLGSWWTRYQEADDNKRRQMVADLGGPKGGGKRKSRRRRRRKPAGDQPPQ